MHRKVTSRTIGNKLHVPCPPAAGREHIPFSGRSIEFRKPPPTFATTLKYV